MKYKVITKFNLLFISVSILILTLISIPLYLFSRAWILITGIWFIYFIPLICYIAIDYAIKKSYYKEIIETSYQLKDKYILPNIIESPDFIEGQILYELLYECSKSMTEQVNLHKRVQLEYREYIEQWVHEIKTPIAGIHLLLENNATKEDIIQELTSIDGYIQQVLYYARSNNPEKDFFVKAFDLTEILDTIIKKHARSFISNGIMLDYAQHPAIVYADSKWTSYIIEQIIINAFKYSKNTDKKIAIYGEEKKTNYVLVIEDNGIGIPSADLPRIFDKGFTGENGRKYSRSTGMGLYLCKNLCDKLFVGLNIESSVDKGTKVILTFPKTSSF